MSRPSLYEFVLQAIRRVARIPRNGADSQLAIEERLVLSPKQQVTLIRCGGSRFLLATSGDTALAWLPLGEPAVTELVTEPVTVPVPGPVPSPVTEAAAGGAGPSPRRRTARSSPGLVESIAGTRAAKTRRSQP
jgi:hypothetical protein